MSSGVEFVGTQLALAMLWGDVLTYARFLCDRARAYKVGLVSAQLLDGIATLRFERQCPNDIVVALEVAISRLEVDLAHDAVAWRRPIFAAVRSLVDHVPDRSTVDFEGPP